jgi:hypothetical protein
MKQNTKRGFATIEIIFGLTSLLITTLIIIGIYTYTFPRNFLEKEMTIIAQEVQRYGGLTEEQYTYHIDRLKEKGFDDPHIEVNHNGYDYTHVYDLGNDCSGDGTPFVRRNQGRITIVINTSANISSIYNPLKFFGLSVPDRYSTTSVVLSERNAC